jgi:hypothetical protein
MALAHSQAAADFVAALGKHHLGLTPGVLHHPDIPDPNAVREARAHGFDNRLLGGKAHGNETLGPLRARELRLLFRQQQVIDETRAEFLQCAADALRLEHVHADTENHGRAATINCFMSRMAGASPSNTARAMMECPMLSSTMSRIAATGCTL